jgi:hypothetical protein
MKYPLYPPASAEDLGRQAGVRARRECETQAGPVGVSMLCLAVY